MYCGWIYVTTGLVHIYIILKVVSKGLILHAQTKIDIIFFQNTVCSVRTTGV